MECLEETGRGRREGGLCPGAVRATAPGTKNQGAKAPVSDRPAERSFGLALTLPEDLVAVVGARVVAVANAVAASDSGAGIWTNSIEIQQ